MIIDNENKKLLRNRKRRIDRKNKINEHMKLLLIKIEFEKKKKNKNFDKTKQLEILLVGIKYANNPNKLQSEIRELKKFMLLIKIYTKLNKKYYKIILVHSERLVI